MTLSFPPFRGAVRALVIINVAVFFLIKFGNIGAGSGFEGTIYRVFGFIPLQITHHFWLWQFITYGFIHSGLSHVLVNMLMLWMFGSTLLSDWGRDRFLQLYFFSMIGAALTTMAIGYLGLAVASSQAAHAGVTPFWASLALLLQQTTVGASGAVYGLLIAFGILYAEQELFLFPIPFRIKAKYMVAILILIVFASALQPGTSGVATFAHLGGLLFGWIYVRHMPKHAFSFSLSERYYGMRNSYYRWKRRRAARKFEVYMRKHDRSEYFDEYGNFRDPANREDPETRKKGNGEHRGPWVN